MKLEIYGYGGEFNIGSVKEKDVFTMMVLKRFDMKEEYPEFEYKDRNIAHYEYNDITGLYNIDCNEINSIILYEENEEIELDISQVINITLSNPYINDYINEENEGFIATGIFEKKMYTNIEIKESLTKDDILNGVLIFLTINMDETLGYYEIIDEMLFIKNKKEADEILKIILENTKEEKKEIKELLEEDYKTDGLRLYVSSLITTIIEMDLTEELLKYSLGEMECEGGRHVENEVVLFDKKGNVIE